MDRLTILVCRPNCHTDQLFFQSSNNRPFYASRRRDSSACGIPALLILGDSQAEAIQPLLLFSLSEPTLIVIMIMFFMYDMNVCETFCITTIWNPYPEIRKWRDLALLILLLYQYLTGISLPSQIVEVCIRNLN